MRYYVTLGGRELTFDLSADCDGLCRVESDGKELDVDVVDTGPTLSVRVDGRSFDLLLDDTVQPAAYALGRSRSSAEAPSSRGRAAIENERSRASSTQRARGTSPHTLAVIAPMPGRIVRVTVKAGDVVQKGTPLIVIEAMKMENELRASRDARIGKVLVTSGEAVERGALLLTFD